MTIDVKFEEKNSTFNTTFENVQVIGTGSGTGVDGKSAYEIWLEQGNTGTEQDFLNSLKGDKGDTGEAGYTPQKGVDYFTEADKQEIAKSVDIPEALPNPHKLTFTGAVTAEYDGSEEVTVDIPASGGEWRKAVYLKTTEDLTYINVTEDDEGNPLSFDEALVVFTTARASTATSNGSCVISVAPMWTSSFNYYGIYNFPLNADVYAYGVYFKKVNDLIVGNVQMYKRVAGSFDALHYESFVDSWIVSSRVGDNTHGNTINSHEAIRDGYFVFDYFNSEGKLCGVTIGTDLASNIQIGTGSILEVWVK